MATPSTSQFGRYELRGVLGTGGFAQVYRAWDTLLYREVALKALLPHLAEDDGVRARFLNEARALARLRHAAIVTVFDVGEVAGRPYFTMEIVEGQSLAGRYPSGTRVSLAELLPVLENAGAAVDYLHSQGFVHRDIKPANIMLSTTGRVLLMDFGIARALNESGATLTGTSVGTPEYMAPEQIRGRPVGPEADIYALGVLCYRLLAGRAPFVGDTGAVLVGHASEPPPPLQQFRPDLPGYVLQGVEQALAKDPAQRHHSAAALYEALAHRDVAQLTAAMPQVVATPDDVPTERSGQNVWASPPPTPPTPLTPPIPPTPSSRQPVANRQQRPMLIAGLVAAVLVLGVAGVGAYTAFSHKAGPTPTAIAATVAPTTPPVTPTVPARVPVTREPPRTLAPASLVPSSTRPSVAPSLVPTQAPSVPPTNVTVVRTVIGGSAPSLLVSKRFGAALHTAPDSAASVLSVLPCGRTLSEVSEQNGWIEVSSGTQTGWVGAVRLVSAGTAVDCRGAVTYQVNSLVAVQVQSGCLSLRDTPSRNAHFSQCANNGTTFRVTGGPIDVQGEDWLPVTNATLGSGWVLAADVRAAN